MKKYHGLICLIIICRLLVVFTGCAGQASPGEEPADDRIVLRFAESLPAEHPSAKLSAEFAQRVYEESEGRIEIRVQYGGALGDEEEALEQLRFGGLAFARITLLSLTDELPLMERYAVPYDYSRSRKYMEQFQQDMALIEGTLEREKLVLMASLYPAQRCIANNLRPVRDVEDLADLRLATPSSSSLGRYYTDLEAYPVAVRENGLLRSLGNGFVDGAEMTLLSYQQGNYSAFMHHVSLTSGLFSPDLILVGSVSLGGIDNEAQRLILACGEEVYRRHEAELLAGQERALAELGRAEVVFIDSPALDESIRLFREAA